MEGSTEPSRWQVAAVWPLSAAFFPARRGKSMGRSGSSVLREIAGSAVESFGVGRRQRFRCGRYLVAVDQPHPVSIEIREVHRRAHEGVANPEGNPVVAGSVFAQWLNEPIPRSDGKRRLGIPPIADLDRREAAAALVEHLQLEQGIEHGPPLLI